MQLVIDGQDMPLDRVAPGVTSAGTWVGLTLQLVRVPALVQGESHAVAEDRPHRLAPGVAFRGGVLQDTPENSLSFPGGGTLTLCGVQTVPFQLSASGTTLVPVK